MGNCAASRLAGGGDEAEDVVVLCRDRKRLLKAAVQRRYDLAEAHARYTHALHDVAAAVREFVARHSTPTLITLPAPPPTTSTSSPPSSFSDPASFLRQTPSEAKIGAVGVAAGVTYRSSCSSSSSSCAGIEGEVHGVEMGGGDDQLLMQHQESGGGYFFNGSTVGMQPPPSPPGETFGWDFFNPFDGVRAADEVLLTSRLVSGSDDDIRTAGEKEGIPDLQHEKSKSPSSVLAAAANGSASKLAALSNGGNVLVTAGNDQDLAGAAASAAQGPRGGRPENGLTVVDAPERERELLDGLRDVEDHFIRAYHSGKNVSRMLEVAQRNPLNSAIAEIKENSSKIIHAIAWHRTTSARSSSYRSFLASSSRTSELDLFQDYGGMISGSHSQTLERLYAWEKKLYQEVKTGDQIRKLYHKKCSHLRSQDVKGVVDARSTDKTKAAAKDLYTRIWVTLKSVQTISERIEKLRDEELLPQLLELLRGLTTSWKVMLESHETQNMIMSEVNTFACPAYGKFCSDLHQLATVKLDEELQIWRSCFVDYIEAQTAYVKAIQGWLSKFLASHLPAYSLPPYRVGAPPIYVICHDWLAALTRLPHTAVSLSLKAFCRDLKLLRAKQGEELHQKRKVVYLAKDIDRRSLAHQRSADYRLLEYKLVVSEPKGEFDVGQQVQAEAFSGRNEHLDVFKNKLEAEKAKHYQSIQETQRMTLKGLRTGFMNVFHSLTDFSRDTLRMYNDLLVYYENFSMAESREEASAVEGKDTDRHKQPDTEETVVS